MGKARHLQWFERWHGIEVFFVACSAKNSDHTSLYPASLWSANKIPHLACVRIGCSWTLYNVARHPDVQTRLRNELRAAGLLHVQGNPDPRQLEWSDLTALPYLNAAIKESLRSHTTAATGTVRCSACLEQQPCHLNL
jgi:hypothetical protein